MAALTGPIPEGKPIWYQKHMTHHLLAQIDHDWIRRLRNVLLIRDPREVVASYVKSRATVTAQDIGLPQQVALYDELSASGEAPPVIDSGEFLRAPEPHLRALCAWLGHRLLSTHAALAQGSARKRRRLGAALVCACVGIHGIRSPCSPRHRP